MFPESPCQMRPADLQVDSKYEQSITTNKYHVRIFADCIVAINHVFVTIPIV